MAAKWQAAPLPDGSYADAAHPFTSQDLINYIPEYAPHEGTRGPVKLMGAPGLQEFSSAGSAHRGARNVEGKLFVVSGTGLYQIGTNGSVTSLGIIPGAGQVSMSHNQIANGNQLLIVNGSSGYIWNTVTSTLTRITSASYPGAVVADFVGQLFVQVEPLRRYFFNSSLADGLTYNALETYEAEASPDRLVAIKVNHRELYAFGETTTEVFDYTGVTNSLFQNKGITIPYGLAAPFALANLDNSTFFLGSDGTVYRLSGYDAARVSTHCIEQDISTCDISKAYAFTYEDRGHKVFYLTFPDGHTWGYDCATQKWHRRESYGLTRWRLASLVFWNNAWYGGEWNSGRIFKLNWDYMLEGCDEHVSEYTTGVAHNNQNRMQFHGLEIVVDTGSALSVCAAVFTLRILQLNGNVPNGATGTVISYQYLVVGGQAPYSLAITSGTLPTGLSMNTSGLVTGTMTTAGSFSWVVTVTDNIGTTATLADTSVVASTLYLTGSPPNGTTGTAYAYSGFTAFLGTAPYVAWAVTVGTLPTGVVMSATTGVLSGTPTVAGTFAYTVRVTDNVGSTATLAVSSVIASNAFTFNLSGVTNAGTTSAVGYTLPQTLVPGNTLTLSLVNSTYTGWQPNPAQLWYCRFNTTDPTNGTITRYALAGSADGPAALTLAQAAGPIVLTGVTGQVVIWIYDTPTSDNVGGLSFSYTVS